MKKQDSIYQGIEKEKNSIVLYGACELGRIYINTNKIYKNHGLDKLPSIIEDIYSLDGYVDDKTYMDFLYSGKILEAYYEMNKGQFTVAYKLLEEAKLIYEKYPNHIFPDMDIEIKIACADLEAGIGNYGLAEKLYIEVESEILKRGSEEFELPIISSITNMYFKSGDVKKFTEKAMKKEKN